MFIYRLSGISEKVTGKKEEIPKNDIETIKDRKMEKEN